MKTNKQTNTLKKGILDHINKPIAKIVIYDIAALLLILASLYLFKVGGNVVFSETPKIDYSLNGNIDYKVRLKNNEYYEDEYLKSGMQYIASLIKSIDINFKYEGHASEKIDYKYKYNVSATTLVTSKNDKSKILFENKEYIVKDNPMEVNDKSFVINDVISIDYSKYNDYITGYKREYLLNSLFDLIVTIHIETIGKSEISDDGFSETNDFIITIPLSEQIIDITLKSPNYQISGFISGIENKTIKAKILYGSGIILVIISLGLILCTLIMIISKNKKRSEYNKIVEKYLKEYDRAIVITHQSNIDEDNFKQVIEISSIQEMLDLHDNFQLPILYYEIIKNEESYFVIIKDNVLYKLVINKKILDKNSGDK